MSDVDDNNKPDPSADLLARTEKLSQDNDRLSKQLEQVLSAISTNQAAQQPVKRTNIDEEDLEVLAYKDPKRYAERVKEDAARSAEAMIERRLQSQNQTNAILGQLTNDYPELANPSSELTKKAVELYNQMSPSEKSSPTSYKIAVRDAAAEVGLLPKSKRKGGSDDFSFSGGSGGGSSSRPSSKKEELSDATLAFAEAIGLKINDKAVVDRIKKRAERKNWGKYE